MTKLPSLSQEKTGLRDFFATPAIFKKLSFPSLPEEDILLYLDAKFLERGWEIAWCVLKGKKIPVYAKAIIRGKISTSGALD